jgi:enolase-phosphatase E1
MIRSMIGAILTDVEGTTTSVSFVYDVLFPYARQHLAELVREHRDDPEVRRQLDLVQQEAGAMMADEVAVETLLGWMDEDRKVAPLKTLQGMIWRTGYLTGGFTGHLYPDAVAGLRRWHDEGLRLYVYSSGSVEAQRLLFGHSDFGDLTPLFSGYFDTRIGAKREPQAYRAIAAKIGLPAERILFLSDVAAELDAAWEAGMQTVWLVRGGTPDPAAGHRQVASFDAIDPGAM